MFYLFLLVSILLYLLAPWEYSNLFCTSISCVYLLECVLFLKNEIKDGNYLTINSLFLFSFFFVTYAFPAFLYDSEAGLIHSFINKMVNYKYINKAVALSHLAINFYFVGFIVYRKIRHKNKENTLSEAYDKRKINWTSLNIAYSLFYILAITVFIKHLLYGSGVAVTESPYAYDLYRMFFTVCLCLSTNSKLKKINTLSQYVMSNKYYMITSGVFMIICLLIGERGPIIFIGLVIIATYLVFVRKISLFKLLVSVIIGVLLMFTIRENRGSQRNSSGALISVQSIWDVFADLTGIYGEMTVGYEYVQLHGIKYPATIFILPFSPIPKAPSIFSELIYEKPYMEISSGKVIQKYTSHIDSWNNGTHCVSDIYIHWGMIGVIITFFIYGIFISSIYSKSYKSVYYSIIYIVILANSLYLPRSSLFDIIRSIAYIYIFLEVFAPKRYISKTYNLVN